VYDNIFSLLKPPEDFGIAFKCSVVGVDASLCCISIASPLPPQSGLNVVFVSLSLKLVGYDIFPDVFRFPTVCIFCFFVFNEGCRF